MIQSELLTTRIFLVTFTLKVGQQKYLLLIISEKEFLEK